MKHFLQTSFVPIGLAYRFQMMFRLTNGPRFSSLLQLFAPCWLAMGLLLGSEQAKAQADPNDPQVVAFANYLCEPNRLTFAHRSEFCTAVAVKLATKSSKEYFSTDLYKQFVVAACNETYAAKQAAGDPVTDNTYLEGTTFTEAVYNAVETKLATLKTKLGAARYLQATRAGITVIRLNLLMFNIAYLFDIDLANAREAYDNYYSAHVQQLVMETFNSESLAAWINAVTQRFNELTSSLTIGDAFDPICGGNNGSINFTSTGISAGTQTLNYTKDNGAISAPVTVAADGSFILPNLGVGVYANFAIGTTTATGSRTLVELYASNPEHYWLGCTNTDWNMASNWSKGTVPTASNDVVIPGTATNMPTISTTDAVAKSIEIKVVAILTIASTGQLTINDSKSFTDFTGAFRNLGTVHNNGKVVLGTTAPIGQRGLQNNGTFNNNATGEVSIDRSTVVGLRNNATFTNDGKVHIGSVQTVGDYGINNDMGGEFDNNATGEISIDRSVLYALVSNSPFTNTGKLNMGSTQSVGERGISSIGPFTNNATGEITINRSTSIGLFSFATFINNGKINLGSTEGIGVNGLESWDEFTNNATGEITINRSTADGLVVKGKTFTNYGKINIGTTQSVGPYGLVVEEEAFFTNHTTGEITIDRSTTIGLYNISTFTNYGKITIGSAGAVGMYAIYSQFNFDNSGCSALIDVKSNNVIRIAFDSPFTNSGLIIERASGNSSISSNTGVVQNLNGGTFNVGSGPNQSIATVVTNATVCSPANGSIKITGLKVATTYTLSYAIGDGNPVTVSPNPTSNANGEITLSGLGVGSYTLTLGGECLPVALGLSATVGGPSYTLNLGTITNLTTCNGTGSIAFGTNLSMGIYTLNYKKNDIPQTPATINVAASSFSLSGLGAGDYTHFSINHQGCTIAATGGTALANPPLPTVFTITGGGSFCGAGAGVPIGLDGSQSGVSYQLKQGNDNVGQSQQGNGNALSFGNQNVTGTYTVFATNTTTNCSLGMAGTATVAIFVLPPATATSNSPVCTGNTLSLSASGGTSYTWAGVGGFVATSANPTRSNVTTNMAGGYTLTVRNDNGCTATSSISVVVNILPNATASNNGSICMGNTLNLSASGGSQYKWAGVGGFTATGANPTRSNATTSMAGTYSVTVLSLLGCTASATTSVVVSNPATNGVLSSNTPIVVGLSIDLKTTTFGTSYTWKGPDAWTSNLKDPYRGNAKLTMNGVYTLTVKGSNACTGTNTISVKVVPKSTREAVTEDINLEKDQVIDMQINAYPNPITNTLTVEVRLKKPAALTLELFNSIGQKNGRWRLAEESTHHKTELDLSTLTGGMYLLQAQSQDGKQKVVKRVVKIQY